MDLIKEHWTNKDIEEFIQYEAELIGDENDCSWEQRIVNTKLKCFGKTSQKAKILTKSIKKGNFYEFLDKFLIKNHLDSLLYAFLVCEIKDFEIFKNYLIKYVNTIDNWASADTLKFQKRNYEQLFSLSRIFLASKKTFVKRVGLNIYFELIKNEKFLPLAFNALNRLGHEQEYYVNMCGAWLLAECFAKYRDQTLKYFTNNSTNSFIINKGIAKCRDSFRISQADKQLLLKYKKP